MSKTYTEVSNYLESLFYFDRVFSGFSENKTLYSKTWASNTIFDRKILKDHVKHIEIWFEEARKRKKTNVDSEIVKFFFRNLILDEKVDKGIPFLDELLKLKKDIDGNNIIEEIFNLSHPEREVYMDLMVPHKEKDVLMQIYRDFPEEGLGMFIPLFKKEFLDSPMKRTTLAPPPPPPPKKVEGLEIDGSVPNELLNNLYKYLGFKIENLEEKKLKVYIYMAENWDRDIPDIDKFPEYTFLILILVRRYPSNYYTPDNDMGFEFHYNDDMTISNTWSNTDKQLLTKILQIPHGNIFYTRPEAVRGQYPDMKTAVPDYSKIITPTIQDLIKTKKFIIVEEERFTDHIRTSKIRKKLSDYTFYVFKMVEDESTQKASYKENESWVFSFFMNENFEFVENRTFNDNMTFILELLTHKPKGIQTLNSFIGGLNMILREVAGDGNCLFRCFSVFRYGTEDRYPEVRKDIMNFIENGANHSLFIPDSFPDVTALKNHVLEGRRDKNWGTDADIVAEVNISKIRVKVVSFSTSLGKQVSAIEYVPANGLFSSTHYLINYSDLHFNILLPGSGFNDNDFPK